jgi:hypothetical protein
MLCNQEDEVVRPLVRSSLEMAHHGASLKAVLG